MRKRSLRVPVSHSSSHAVRATTGEPSPASTALKSPIYRHPKLPASLRPAPCIAVSQAWIDVRTMADIDDVATSFRQHHDRKMRVATKYINLTRDFFSSHGIIDYRIIESSGATEGAPAAGTAEMIVDITTT